MQDTSLSYKTLRNTLYLFANFLLPMAFTVYVTRVMVFKLGASEYGIYLLVTAIASFVNFVDLGLSTAVTKYTAEYIGSGDKLGLEKLLSSSRMLFFLTGSLGLVIFFVLGKWFLPLFKITGSTENNIFIVFLLAGITFLFTSLSTVYGAVLSALQRFDLLTKISIAGLVITSIGNIILLKNQYQLKAVMSFNVVIAFITLFLFHYLVRKLMPELRLSYILDKIELKKAYTFGILAFTSNLASNCLIYFDRLFITIFLGPAQLPFYSVPGNIALKTSVVTNSFGQILFPMASEFAGAGEIEKLKNIYIKAFRNLHIISAAVTVSIIVFGERILFFWLGGEYAQKSSKVLVVLALTYFIVALYIPLQGLLLGLGKLKFLIRQSIFMAVLNLALLLLLVPKFGIMGAGWAYFIAVIPMAYAFYWTEKNLFNLSNRLKDYFFLYLKLIFVSLVDGLICYYFLLSLVSTIWALIIIGPLSILLYFILYYIFGFMDKEDSNLFKAFVFKFLRFA